MADLKVDLRDRKILYYLDINARQPLSMIAKKTGLSKEVVNYRINRMLDEGIIRSFYARIDTSKLGLTLFRTFIRMQNLTPQKEKEFIGYIAKNPKIGFFTRVEGNFDFNFIYWTKSVSDYFYFWKELNIKFGKFIAKKELHILEYYANFQKGFLVGKKDLSIPFFECGLKEEIEVDKIDYDMLNILAANGRKPLIEIAKQLGISDKVVSYRLKKLEKAGVIHSYGVQLALDKVGLHYYKLHLFLKNFSAERFNALKNFAITNPDVVFIDEALGGPDFEIELYLKTKQEYYAFLSKLRYKFSDLIRDFETLYYPEEFKLVLFPWKG